MTLKSITQKKLLIVEGRHEVKFFGRLLMKMGLQDIQVFDIGGKDFNNGIDGLRGVNGFQELQSLAILRDADTSFENMFMSVANTLKKLGFPVPTAPNELANGEGKFPNTLIFIFPDNKSNGALEHLCISSVSDDPTLDCVEAYFSCLNEINDKYGVNHPHPQKARVQAFLAREEEGDVHMGIGAEKDIWNWDSPVFAQVKGMLIKL